MLDRFFRFILLAATLATVGCGSVSSSGNNANQAPPATPNFSLSVPTEIAVTPNSSQTISISVAPANGFSSAVSVVLSGLLAGVSASPATFTLTSATLSQTVVITANADITPGPVALVVTATSGSLSQSMTTNTSQADFALSGPSQPIGLAAGGTAQVSVSAAGFNGFGGQVSAALAGLPAGVTASPSTLMLTSGVAQTITLSAAADAQPGSATLTLQGTSGVLSGNLMLPLALSAAAPPQPPQTPDFSLSVVPAAITLAAGGSPGQVTLSATALNGFAGPISVALSGLPSGMVAMPAGFTLTPGTPQQISLTVAATDTAAAATLVFSASAGTLAHTAELAVTITPPQPTFSLQVTPATLTLSPGGGAQSVSVSATPLYGFSGPINVVGSGLPAAVTASPSSFTLTPGVAQTVSVTAGSNAAAGTAFLNFLGASGTVSNSASVGLTINASTPDFVFSATPSSITVIPGTFQPVTLSIVPLSGFNSGVTVTTGSLPGGVVVSPQNGVSGSSIFPVPESLPPLAPNVPEVVYVGLPAGQSAPVTIDFQAVAGALTHSATVTANPASTTNASSDFYLDSAPQALLLYPGETSAQMEVTGGSFGVNGSSTPTITLTSSLPSGMTATVTNIPANDLGLPSPGIDVNFTVASNLVGSSGTLAFQATSGASSGSITREIDVPYSVVAASELTQLLIPSTLTLPQGSTENLYVALATTPQAIDGIAPGMITVTGLPFGVTTTETTTNFSAIFPDLFSEPLSAAPTTAVGSTPVTVTTTANGGQTQTSQFMLNIVSIPNFTLTATPTTFDMMEGTTQTFTLEANAINGFTGNVSVTLTASGEITVTPSTFTLTPGTPQTISVTAANTSGGSSIVVQATAGTLSQTLIVPVNVTPPGPNFSIAAGGITLGETTSGEFEVNSIGGFVGNITEVLSGLPAGLLLAEGPNMNDLEYSNSASEPSFGLYATCGSQPSQSNPGSDCTAYVFVFDYNGLAAGTYPLTLTATYTPGPTQPEGAPTYPITYTYQVPLVVTPPTFPCTASPASLTIAPGSSQNITISAPSLSGYEDLFSYSGGLPSGVTPTVSSSTSPIPPGTNYTTTYTLSAAANATAGSSIATFTCQNEISPPDQPGFGLNAYATETVQVPITIGP